MGVTPGYNITQDTSVFFELVNSPTNDPNCFYFPTNASPRPPVNDILFFHSYSVSAEIGVGSTYNCKITVTFEQPGELETVWRITYRLDNNTEVVDLFTFRGQALPIPLNMNIMLMLLLILVTAWFFKIKY